jgi:Fe-S oxidoreductase
MNQVLENYELGKPKYKPKLLEQIFKMEEKRAKQLENNLQQQNLFNNRVNPCINPCINPCVTTLRNEYEKKIADKNILINELLKKIKHLTHELSEFKSKP